MYPLVVDLDGTITRTDTLYESIFQLIKKSPLLIFMIPFWIIKGKAYLKTRVAEKVSINPETLPYNNELLEYIQEQQALGRSIHLATAAHISIAKKVAGYLNIFDSVLATTDKKNLKGVKKLHEIQKTIGTQFTYAGDNKSDIIIWESSQSAILVNVSNEITRRVSEKTVIEKAFNQNSNGIAILVKACRLHQWLKNLLIFIPLFTAFSFTDLDKVGDSILAFFSFSLLASATYILNDLWDLESDRKHPRKKNRPFASGLMSIPLGVFLSLSLLIFGLILGSIVSVNFLYMLLLYLVMTLSYSLVFKTYVLIDVIFLSLLFTIRILSGAVAISVSMSAWLLSFSVFIFLSLALVKRCSELVSLKSNDLVSSSGRDYQVSDLIILWPLGVGAALSAVVIFGLFINDPDTKVRYQTPEILWLASIGLIYWLSRVWVKTARGEMHDDPVVFAIKDRGSLITVLAIISVILVAHFFSLQVIR